MKRLYTAAIVLALASSAAVQARTISPDQALERAFSSSTGLIKAPGAQKMELKYVVPQPDSDVAGVYVFDSPAGGFYVLSADDQAEAVLGYADSGTFDVAQMPASLRWWLGFYAGEISRIPAGEATSLTFKKASSRTERAAIEPMVKTLWDQSAPYNDDCPLINGARAVTGCVATALAQIMNYHQWPVTGTGSNSYTDSETNTTYSMNFADVTFDWANMADVYNSQSSAAQNAAVATLMHACGVGVNMQYTADESGAVSADVAKAMKNYFGYDPAVVCLYRQYYTASEWEDLVYNQLVEYGPVQYGGDNSTGGHSFVCDGYSSDGYFHINWGWSGMSNGYFLLSALNPTAQGIGGSVSGYNSDQDITANVSKPRAGSKVGAYMACPDGFSISASSAQLGSDLSITGPIYNLGNGSVSGVLGLKIVNKSTGEVTYAAASTTHTIAMMSGYSGYTVTLPASLPEGNYSVMPAFRTTDGDWYDGLVDVSAGQTADMSVQGTTAYFTAVTGASLSASNLTLDTPLYSGQVFKATATLTNSGESEFYGPIYPALVQNGEMVGLGLSVSVTLEGGQSQQWQYIGKISQTNGTLSAGSYYLCLVRESGQNYEPVSDQIPVTLNASTSVSLSVPTLSVVGDSQAVDGANAQFQAQVSASAYFAGTVDLVIFDGETEKEVTSTGQTVFVEASTPQTVTFSVAIPQAEPDHDYIAALYEGQNQISNGLWFKTASASSGIDAIEQSAAVPYPNPTYGVVNFGTPAPENSAVYTVSGTKVATIEAGATQTDLGEAAAGLYLLRLGEKTYRIIKR